MALVGLAILIWAPSDSWYREPSLFSALLVVASAGSLWWWRTAPFVALVAASAVFMVNIVAGFPVGITQYPAFIAFYAVFAFGSMRSRWGAAGLLAVTVGVYAIADRGPIDVSAFVGIGVATALAALLGDATAKSPRARRGATVRRAAPSP